MAVATANKAATAVRSGFVVRDWRGEVVLMFWGEDAKHEAAAWADRPGYTTDVVDLDAAIDASF